MLSNKHQFSPEATYAAFIKIVVASSTIIVMSCSLVNPSTTESRKLNDSSGIADAGPMNPGVKPGTESGDLLYGTYCSGCHGQLSDTTKRGVSTENILAALNSVPAMASIKTILNSDHVAKISASLSNTNRPPQDLTVLPNGTALYAANCASCHFPLKTSNRKGSSALAIERGISIVPGMKRLSFLSHAELMAISKELLNPAYDIPQYTVKLPRLLDRRQLSARIKRIYTAGQSTAAVLAVQQVLQDEILTQPQVFGGNCSRTETDCSNHRFNLDYMDADVIPIGGTIRAGRLHRACITIATQDAAMTAFSEALSGKLTLPPTAAQITSAIEKLNLGFVQTTAGAAALVGLINQAKVIPTSPQTQWRLLSVAICSSLAMEAL